MPRKERVFLKDTPQLLVVRGNNKQNIFHDDDDYQNFLEILSMQSKDCGCDIHAYVLMPNHLHLLLSPKEPKSVGRLMQGIGRTYVRYFNSKYSRSGTLWEGRYKSAIVDVANYLFTCMKYVELNPLRSGLAKDPKEYPWSSCRANVSGIEDAVLTPHTFFKSIENLKKNPYKLYESSLNEGLDNDTLELIRIHVNKQTVLGSLAFQKKVEELNGTKLITRDRGRPSLKTFKVLPWNYKENLMFKNIEVLDKKKHANLRLIQKKDFSFAKSLKGIPVVASEAFLLGLQWPLIFSGQEKPAIMALVAVGNSGNLAIDKDGKWRGNYVPAYLQNYPFGTYKVSEENNNTVMVIDADSELLSQEEGQPLFKEDGEQSEVLEAVIKAFKNYDLQHKVMLAAAEAFEKEGILVEREISLGEGEEKKTLVKGFKVIDREKLNALSDEKLAAWVRNGFTSLIDIHIRSLDNINKLVEKTVG